MRELITFLIFGGMGLLSASLIATREICTRDRRPGWLALFGLIVAFIMGYGVFLFMLPSQQLGTADLVVAIILFGGGCFVFQITRLSRASIRYISEIANRERFNALHDPLTGLPNRSHLFLALHDAVFGVNQGALLMIDLDRFKEINDALGHHAGDCVLREIGPRMIKALEMDCTLARVGGDEFALILPNSDSKRAFQVAQSLIDATGLPFEIEENRFNIGMSVGIAIFPDNGRDPGQLLQRADRAMYSAKRQRLGCAMYDVADDRRALERLKLTSDLRDAIARDELVVYYQPVIEADSDKVVSLEALVRWAGPDGELIPPDRFIPLAERSDLILQVTQQVLRKGFAQLGAWRQQGWPLSLQINLSARDLHNQTLVSEISKCLQSSDLSGNQVAFEITESAMMVDIENARAILNAFDQLGATIAIDDFGTGFSSLTLLREFPVRQIKIDRSFVIGMNQQSSNLSIVRSTIYLGHNLGCTVVAEGVETDDDRHQLTAMGCDRLQGYAIAKPMNAQDATRWLESRLGPGPTPNPAIPKTWNHSESQQ